MSRPVHVRRIRASRRSFTPMHGTRADRVEQVRALCGAWVPRCEAVRTDNLDATITCETCFARAEAGAEG